MNVGGGLRYVVGPMGAGKSLYGVRCIIASLLAGKYVVSNVRLLEKGDKMPFSSQKEPLGWDVRVARQVTRDKAKQETIRRKLRSYYIYEPDFAKATRYYPEGEDESRALMMWDEAHNDLNNRTYRDRDQWQLTWATQLRKLGFEGVLLSQSAENTDAQLRRICNFLVKLQNQREKMRMPVIHTRMPFLPALHLAAWYDVNDLAQGSSNVRKLPPPIKVERYLRGYYVNLYNTHALYHEVSDLIESGELITLPKGGLPLRGVAPARQRVAAPAANGGVTNSRHSSDNATEMGAAS